MPSDHAEDIAHIARWLSSYLDRNHILLPPPDYNLCRNLMETLGNRPLSDLALLLEKMERKGSQPRSLGYFLYMARKEFENTAST